VVAIEILMLEVVLREMPSKKEAILREAVREKS